MIHPDTELRYIDDSIGYGVFARKLIRKGAITWVPDPLQKILTSEEVDALPVAFKDLIYKYSYRSKEGLYYLEYDFGRYVNHSSNANCLSTAYDFELAVRDILPGEELTDDYGMLNIDEPFECFPEPGTSRTLILPDDLLRYHAEWDARLKDAFQYLRDVEQPLFQLMPAELQAIALAVSKGEIPMESTLTSYFDPSQKPDPKGL